MKEYLKHMCDKKTTSTGYTFMKHHADEFSRDELVAIIQAFDCVILPRIYRYSGVMQEIHSALIFIINQMMSDKMNKE